MKKNVFVFLFDGFADWEIAYLTPEIKKNKQFELIYFSKKRKINSINGRFADNASHFIKRCYFRKY